jgi:hypothetical protein
MSGACLLSVRFNEATFADQRQLGKKCLETDLDCSRLNAA